MDEMTIVGFRALDELLHEFEQVGLGEVPELTRRCAALLGLRDLTIYLADVQQDVLIPMPQPEAPEGDREPPVLDIDDSLAGWSYRTASLRVTEAETGGLQLWTPMMDGVERMGVLGLRGDCLDAPTLRFCRSLATLLTLIVVSKGSHSDIFTGVKRREAMHLPAEMVWAFLPPRTLQAQNVLSTAVLEPAYDIGGDGFDHSLIDHTLHTTILDSMGHDLKAGLTTSVALAGCRNARRSGADLKDLTGSVDDTLAAEFPDRYCTGIFAHLDLPTGELTWTNAGHPPPLLIRDQRLMHGALERPSESPLGLGTFTGHERQVHHEQLQPRDRVLLYTDGVTEARSDSGEMFGLDTFADFIIRATAAGEPAYEVLRRLIHSILAHHHQLSDDATIVLFEWQPGPQLPPVTPVLL
ncbi:PP2C family protein-serine/threonine phosphatase [Streptomyces sp. NPDC051320]|uniref:PP2C family protein-serine/threonine phosphatase n=1 Tax=Streptomyces sp. NPDC051320 TaxID=3154644 RepID=UPI003447800E